MEVVLDPRQRENYLSAERVNIDADLLLCSSLTAQLDPDYARRIHEADPHFSVLDTNTERDMRLRTLTEYCLAAIMTDGAGRSLPHLAAEVCRLSAELRTISVAQGDDQTFRFGDDDPLQQSRRGFWKPTDVPMKVPTITGQSKHKPDYMRWGYLGSRRIPSLHAQWEHLTSRMLALYARDNFGQFKVTKIEPPFELSSGELVERTTVPFYRGEAIGGSRKAASCSHGPLTGITV